MTFSQLLNKKYVIFDGAMGTELQNRGLKPGEIPESFNFAAPEKVAEVTRNYAQSGSDIVSTNTFGANRYKLSALDKSVEEVIVRAAQIAKKAVADYPDTLVALDIGPIGKLMRPTGTMSFEEAYDLYAEQVKAGVKAGVELIALQTFSDLLELKCAALAAKENSSLPLIASMTFEGNGRTFTGCPASAYAVTASGLGADIIGVNCSLGPKELTHIVDELLRFSDAPVMVKPNAGLPDPVSGKFTLPPMDFAVQMSGFAAKGVKLLGGCCGTSPEYITELIKHVKRVNIVENSPLSTGNPMRLTVPNAVCSGVKTVVLDQPRVIGERINPTGKRVFKEALKSSDTDYILGQAFEQTEAGADILDVNVGLPEIDEKEMMLKVVEALQSVCDLPLQIDSSSPDVLEAALRRYNGKPIVNSVNGKEESLSAVLPLVKKYGAAVIGLTLDENGIPDTAEKRLLIAEKILDRALSLGIKRENVIIDCLTLTISTDSQAAQTTLDAVKAVSEKLGLNTALGVSNVSFGLPNREIINSAFLTSALGSGLTLPIINPNSRDAMGAVRAFRLLSGRDPNAADYVAAYSQKESTPSASPEKSADSHISLAAAIQSGLRKEAVSITAKTLEEGDDSTAMNVVNEQLIPALDAVGTDFEKGKIFLPQLILAAETAGACFDVIKANLGTGASRDKGVIILATVKGDIHDIGKNIVKVILENYGYKIIDLGKDVPPETVADSAEKHGVKLVGLSALMTTTLPSMSQTIELIRERGLRCKVMVGGAVLNADYAEAIGADYYARDAKGAADIAKGVFG